MIPGLVTTIIPVFNRAEPLREAVASVVAQTWRPVEVVIVDDGSTDETPRTIRALQAEHPDVVRTVIQANCGAGAAREAGLRAARGEFIQYLDSDDTLAPSKFELQVAGLRGNPECGISYGLVRDAQLGTPSHHSAEPFEHMFPHVLQSRLWPTLSPLYRRSVCDAIGPWSTRRIFEDWDYDCRAALLGVRLHHCPELVAWVWDRGDAHAGMAWQHDAQAMRDRIHAYLLVAQYARRGGLRPGSPDMQRIVRSLFWIAREAAAYGLASESAQLLQVAQSNAQGPQLQMRAFHAAARLMGWRRAGQLARMVAEGKP